MARIALVAAALLLSAAAMPGGQAPPERPLAVVAELDGIIHPVSAEYLTGVIDQADTSGADIHPALSTDCPGAGACSLF